MNKLLSVNNTTVQASTVNTDFLLTDGEGLLGGAYPLAFYVGMLGSGQTSIQELASQEDVVVEVYKHNENQNSQYSLYQPDYVFKLSEAVESDNPGARYWHPFNIVFNPDTCEYDIVEVGRENYCANSQNSIDPNNIQNHGIIRTDLQDIQGGVAPSLPNSTCGVIVNNCSEFQDRYARSIACLEEEGVQDGGVPINDEDLDDFDEPLLPEEVPIPGADPIIIPEDFPKEVEEELDPRIPPIPPPIPPLPDDGGFNQL